MNEINVRNEILDSINDLNQITMESTFDVFGSMLNACEKANMITEYASDASELDMFAIFQEAEVSKDGGKDQSFGYKLIHFIPNLIKKLIAVIKSAWSGTKTPEKPSTGLIGLLEKVKGKSAEWIKEHPTEIGVSAAVAAALGTFVAFQNSEKLKDILNKWAKGLKAFYVAAKNSPTIAFEGGSVITNIKTDGLIKSLDKLRDVLKRTTVITKDIAEKKKSIKDIDSELKNIIAKAEEVRKDPNALTGESITANINDFIDLLEKVKGSMESFTELESVDIAAIAKPMSEENSNEQSYVASVNNNAGILSKIANAAAVAWAATSTAAISFIKWIGEGLGIIKKAEAAGDTSEASVNMENQSKGEAKEDEKSEESEALIENKEVDAAVVAVQEEPTKENAEKALNAIEKSINEINTTEGNGKAVQVVKDAKQAVSNVKSYLANKEEIDARDAKKIAAMARGAEDVKKLTVMQNVTDADINKALKKFRTDERQAAVGTERTTKSGEQVSKKRGPTSGLSDAELMEILNNLPGNEIATVNAKQKKIVLKSGKTLTGKSAHYQMDKITRDHNGRPGYGDTGNIRLSNNGKSWTIEYFEDAFDEAAFIFESAIMEYFGISTEDAFVVESADGETVDAEAFVFESYDATEAEAAEINNHWYR